MALRNQLIEVFCTRPELNDSRLTGWKEVPHLRRNMESWMQREIAELHTVQQWALFWHERWRVGDDRFAREHLTSHLYEAAYWAAQQVRSGFHRQLSLSDLCQLAIAGVDKVLVGFDRTRGESQEKYARRIFKNILYRALRENHEVEICTPWSLLRKYSPTRLREALLQRGHAGNLVESCLLACRCYREIYVPQLQPGTRRLQAPAAETWEAITRYYTSQRSGERHRPATVETIKHWLELTADALRHYLSPDIFSTTGRSGDEAGTDLLDLVAPTTATPFDLLVAAEEEDERRQLYGQMRTVLETAMAGLDPQLRQVLALYYGREYNQQQIAEQLQTKQYNISRWLKRAELQLARALVSWAIDKLHVSVDLGVVESVSPVLENWLQAYFESSEPAEQK